MSYLKKNKYFDYLSKKILKINIFILLLLANILIAIIIIFKIKIKNTKVAMCVIGKKENLYIKEFIRYYINLGIDQIFIYDDNEPNTEKISTEIENIYKNLIAIYKKNGSQAYSYNDCYRNNNKYYDWILFVDFDEYLYIKKYSLKNYLNKPVFNKCDFIYFHWVMATDNNLIHYDNRSLFERFKSPYIKSGFIKSIVRGNIKDLKYLVHSPIESPYKNISCNNLGKVIHYNTINIEYISDINIEQAYIIHFRFKSTEEFIYKYKRGYGVKSVLKNLIDEYFKYNDVTLEKILLIQKALRLNLTKYIKE